MVIVDGEWSTWSSYGSCSVTWGPGIKQRNRACNDPAPCHNGELCMGNDNEYVSCLEGIIVYALMKKYFHN